MPGEGTPPFFYLLKAFLYNQAGPATMDKTLLVIEEIVHLEIIKAYAIGGGIAATYYIEPVLTAEKDRRRDL